MRTITNVFLLNLAISDILLGVLCMPVTLVGTLLRHFIFGEFFCKLIQFSQAVSVAVSSWTLVAISCERYYAICHPLSSRRWQTRSHAYKIIACIWFGSMLCMLPIALFSKLMPTSRKGLRKCRENWPSFALPYERSYNLFLDLILLVLPLLILSIAYILITRTLYVGMRIEKATIFDGKQDNIQPPTFQRKSNSGGFPGKSLYLSTSSLSMNTSSSSRMKLNLCSRCHGSSMTNNGSYNNISCAATPNCHANLESDADKTDILCQPRQQQNQNICQSPVQRIFHQHNFQNFQYQHQPSLRDGVQQHQHQSPTEEERSQPHFCCELFSGLCFKRLNDTSANISCRRPHLYCMRFPTLKTTIPDKEGNSFSNFCAKDSCSGSGSGVAGISTGSTSTINVNVNSPNITTTTSTSTVYGNQMHQLQQNHSHCYCMTQHLVPQFNYKTEPKKSFKRKKSLNAAESLLRRNNIAKNFESKKRVIKMLSVLVLEFFICWTPLYIINTVAMYVGAAIYEYIDYTSISVLQLLAYSSSCCNPITYCFMNANFRRAFLDTFKGMQWCGKRFTRKRSTAQRGTNLYLAGSIRLNSCTVQTVIDSPRL